MASFKEEGSVVAVIGDLYGSVAAAHHGIRDDGPVGVHGDVLHGDLQRRSAVRRHAQDFAPANT